jgi:hypothetical protein
MTTKKQAANFVALTLASIASAQWQRPISLTIDDSNGDHAVFTPEAIKNATAHYRATDLPSGGSSIFDGDPIAVDDWQRFVKATERAIVYEAADVEGSIWYLTKAERGGALRKKAGKPTRLEFGLGGLLRRAELTIGGTLTIGCLEYSLDDWAGWEGEHAIVGYVQRGPLHDAYQAARGDIVQALRQKIATATRKTAKRKTAKKATKKKTAKRAR